MNEKIIKNLIKYGLSDSEARAYTSALMLESAPVEKLAKNSGLNRTSLYPILERLFSLGLISQVKKKGKTVIKSVPPEKFFDLLDEKKEAVEDILPDLRSLFDISRGRPDVSFYEGQEGLKTVMNSVLNEAKELYVFGEADSFIKAIPEWTENYVKKRIDKKIKVKMILKASPFAVRTIKQIRGSSEAANKLIKVRMLPPAYKIDYSAFDIFNNKVVLYSFEKQNNATVIESNIISNLMRTVFDILWDAAEKYKSLLE